MKDTKLEISQKKTVINLNALTPNPNTQLLAYDAISKELGLVPLAGKETAFQFELGIPVDAVVSPDDRHSHLALLTVAQVTQLVETEGSTVTIQSDTKVDSLGRHSHTLTISYSRALHTFTVLSVSPGGSIEHSVNLIAGGVGKDYVDAQDAAIQTFVITERDTLYTLLDEADAVLQTQINNIISNGFVTGDAVEAVISDDGDVRMEPNYALYINNGVIHDSHLSNDSVGTRAIADESVTTEKLNPNTINYLSNLQYPAISTLQLEISNIQDVQIPFIQDNTQALADRVGALESYTPLSLTISGQELTLHADSGDSTVTLPSGGATASPATPATPDTVIWLCADNSNGFQRNKITNTDLLRFGSSNPVRITPNVLNGLPVSEWAHSQAVNEDGSLFIYHKQTPGTYTILFRCQSPSNNDSSSVSGKSILEFDYDCDFVVNASYVVTNAAAGSPISVADNWTVVTMQFPLSGDGFVYVNGAYWTSIGTRNYLFSATYGGHLRMFGNFIGQVAEVIASQDSSREAGRLHEQYLKNKYGLTF